MSRFSTSKQRRLLKEEIGVMPISSKSAQPAGQPAPETGEEPAPEALSLDTPEPEAEISLNGGVDAQPPATELDDPYARHMEPEVNESPEDELKVERIGAGLKKMIAASLELENAMAILKSERSDYSRGKALIDIRIQLTDIITQIKTELINLADHNPAVANRVRDVLNHQ